MVSATLPLMVGLETFKYKNCEEKLLDAKYLGWGKLFSKGNVTCLGDCTTHFRTGHLTLSTLTLIIREIKNSTNNAGHFYLKRDVLLSLCICSLLEQFLNFMQPQRTITTYIRVLFCNSCLATPMFWLNVPLGRDVGE